MVAKSAFPNPTELYTYRYTDRVYREDDERNRSWPEDSRMFFKRYRSQEDDEAISQLTTSFKMKIDQEAQRKARLNGGKAPGVDMQQDIKMSGSLAMILVMNRGWEGEYFSVPQWATTSDGRPHPRRGQIAECNEAWIKKMDPVILQDIEDTLSELWEPSAADDETFSGQRARVAGPESERPGAGTEPVRGGADRVEDGENLPLHQEGNPYGAAVVAVSDADNRGGTQPHTG